MLPPAFLLIAGLLLGGALPAAGDQPKPGPPAPAQGTDPPAGDLLIASAHIRDPRFYHAVILLLRHNAKGAFGIVINKPLGAQPIAALLAAAEAVRRSPDDRKGNKQDTGIDGTIDVFAGGPVQPNAGFIVHTPDYHRAETITVDHMAAMTPTLDTLRDIGHHKGPKQYFFALGYAGWGPGQLEMEMARHDWFITPADKTLIFDSDRAELWRKALALRTREL
jgi:putative transcriptional regulator